MTTRRAARAGILLFLLFAAACGQPEQPPTADPAAAESESPAAESAPAGIKPDPARLAFPAALGEEAPATYRVNFETTKGPFVVEVTREWAPRGADRFYNLVKHGFYDGVRFYRVVPNFMVQFGIHGDPKIQAPWINARIPDDPVQQGNQRGYVTFAHGGPNSRTTQLFINYRDNSAALNKDGFAAIGQVVSGMEVVDALYSGYGEMAPRGKGPDQQRLVKEGNAYLDASFPNLDAIKSATLEE
jgi:peptidyl-prolyl cis-trans isomerase A (cyclophilin A)